jgi:hypothetical protein
MAIEQYRYCQANEKLGDLEQLLHCDGIWLHALRCFDSSFSCQCLSVCDNMRGEKIILLFSDILGLIGISRLVILIGQ